MRYSDLSPGSFVRVGNSTNALLLSSTLDGAYHCRHRYFDPITCQVFEVLWINSYDDFDQYIRIIA